MTDAKLKELNPCGWRVKRMTRLIRPQNVADLAVKSEWREWNLQESVLEYLNDLGWRSTLTWITLGLLCVGATYAVPWLLTSIARWFR